MFKMYRDVNLWLLNMKQRIIWKEIELPYSNVSSLRLPATVEYEGRN